MTATTGFIFDLDGVITDTAEYHYRSWQRLADELGIPFSREDNDALRGVPRRRSLELVLKGKTLPEDEMQRLMTLKNDYYRAFLTEVTPDGLLPGVGDFLNAARAAGIRIGLGSASKNARDVLERLGVMGLFDAIGDGNSVVNQKPAPDLFVWVAGALRLPPNQCVVFEDAEAGVDAAKTGGFWTVGIGPVERVGHAHRRIDGFIGVTINDFLPPLM
jgi:beta-phosphoglucomutase